MRTSYESWGRYPKAVHTLIPFYWRNEALPIPESATVLPFGLGRSYGDSCLNNGQALIGTRNLNRLISFDATTGRLRCESGISLGELLDIFVPRGFFLPVTPGTKFVTVGGAIANDVHGKNHHVSGTFGHHVHCFELLRSNGERILCSPEENAELFRATIGGLGLTGLILWAEIQLKPIPSRAIAVDTMAYAGVRDFLDLSSEAAGTHEYLVSWVDCMSGKGTVRGVFMRGNHAEDPAGRVRPRGKSFLRVPVDLPGYVLNPLRETVGDADLLVIAKKAGPVMEFVARMPEVARTVAAGETKISVKLATSIQLDVRVVPRASFGAALHYFTGSKAHNVIMRQIAIKKGLKLNEYGLFRGETAIAGASEEEIFKALDLPYIAPELREDVGEIDAARAGRLPKLIEPGTLRGDLQTQTTWTDGADTLEAMVAEAQRLGLSYMAITDHTRDLAMTGGSDEAKIRLQGKAIDGLNKRLKGFRVLKGAEVNIRKDGTLDIADECLAELDVVGIAVHSHFNLSRAEMTARVLRAMRNPHADILFHPTGRQLNRREPIELDLDAVIACARETGTVLELDAYPDRLDLKDEHVRKVIGAGLKIVIDSDAHSTAQLRFPEDYGIGQARRGWATADDVLNTRPVEAFLAGLKDGGRATTPEPPASARKRGAPRR